jgi:hypothetical protein
MIPINQSKQQYGDDYQKHLFEQYKLYVEMADRVSARRALVNTFFVGLNVAFITAFSVFFKDGLLPKSLFFYVPFIAVMLLCYLWWRLIVSYRQLNAGKFKVIHAFEKMLPVAPYAAEWQALGAGGDKKLYQPLTQLENWVPAIFAVMYGFIALSVCVSQLNKQPI